MVCVVVVWVVYGNSMIVFLNTLCIIHSNCKHIVQEECIDDYIHSFMIMILNINPVTETCRRCSFKYYY